MALPPEEQAPIPPPVPPDSVRSGPLSLSRAQGCSSPAPCQYYMGSSRIVWLFPQKSPALISLSPPAPREVGATFLRDRGNSRVLIEVRPTNHISLLFYRHAKPN